MTLPPRLKHLWREWGSPLVFSLLFTQFAATAVHVDGASMMPTLQHREMVAVPKVEGWAHQLGLGAYQRGQIVVFKPPREAAYTWKRAYRGVPLPWTYRPYLIKRVVGVPGDTVQVRGGVLYVNNRQVDEPGVSSYWNAFCPDRTSPLANTAPLKVPAQYYFVMGDNRSPGGSLDSRMFGPVNVHDIAGRAVASLWPLARRNQIVPPCDGGPDPERRVQRSGDLIFNPRLLEVPR